jgi:hypothetical protein
MDGDLLRCAMRQRLASGDPERNAHNVHRASKRASRGRDNGDRYIGDGSDEISQHYR